MFRVKNGNASRYHDEVERLAKTHGIWHIVSSNAGTLSGGERRRQIVRTLALQPRYLLLDEPFAGLDPLAIAALQGLLRSLADSGIGILMADHNARDTLAVADVVNVLDEGRLCFSGTVAEALGSALVRSAYLGRSFRV